MNHFPLAAKVSGFVFALTSCLVLLPAAHAQTAYYFDPGLTAAGTGSGGTGVWDTDGSDGTGDDYNWYLPGFGDTVFPDLSTANPTANFDGVGGAVTVEGEVDTFGINLDGSTPYTLSPSDSTGLVGFQVNPSSTTNLINNSGSNVDFEVNSSVTETAGTTSTSITNSGAGTLTVGGTMEFSGSTGNYQTVQVNGSVLFNSTVTNTITQGSLGTFDNNGTVYNIGQEFSLAFNSGNSEFNGNILGTSTGFSAGSGSLTTDDLVVNGGSLLVDNGNFNRFVVAQGASLLTNGAVTVSATNSIENGTIGGATADLSTFSGDNPNFGGNRIITAAAGGRVNISGSMYGGGTGPANDLIIEAAGVVAFTNPNGENYAGGYTGMNGDNTEVGTEIRNGTLLAENANQYGSATGSGFNQNTSNNTSSVGENNVVQIDNVTAPTTAAPLAVLGGYGYSLNQIVAVGANSSITPGDITPANLVTTMPPNAVVTPGGIVTPGTLHLFNGLTAVNGLTANFALTMTPSTSSMIALATTSINPDNNNYSNGAPTFALTLGGPITINLYGPINTADTYTLFYSAAGTAWNIAGATFDFNGVPTGYTATEQYVADDAATNDEEINVSFAPAAIPEPSTWALIGLGALILIGSGKLRKLRA